LSAIYLFFGGMDLKCIKWPAMVYEKGIRIDMIFAKAGILLTAGQRF